MKKTILIVKKNLEQQEVWRYQGIVVNNLGNEVTVEAKFNKDDFFFNGIQLKKGDTFIETYYADRWYNIFAMYDRDDGQLKGWYCNITYPANLTVNLISYVDLALDLLVKPDGEQIILDREEFEILDLEDQEREQAEKALEELKALFSRKFSSELLVDPS